MLYKLTNPYFPSERKKNEKKIPKHHHHDGTEMQKKPRSSFMLEQRRGILRCSSALGLGLFVAFWLLHQRPGFESCFTSLSRTEALKLWPTGPFPEGCGAGALRSRRQYMGAFQESACLFRLQKCCTINYTSVLQKISSITAGGAIHQPWNILAEDSQGPVVEMKK